jgi:predicted transcriptional regulator
METTISMKDTVLRAMQNLPDDNPIHTLEIAIDRLTLLKNIEEGLDDIRNGRVHSQAEVEKMSEEWIM